MLLLFGLSTSIHLAQAIYTRRWYLLFTVLLCGIAEVIGWGGRLWSSYGVYNITAYLMQISTTILAPTFLAAANFIILGTIISRVGPEYSRLPARSYAIIFVSVDILSLVIQAIGGGMASIAVQTIDGNPETGGHVMLVGIICQLVEMAIYVLLASEFFLNYKRRKVVRKLKRTELLPPQSDIVPGAGLPSAAEDKPEEEREEITTGDHLELGQEPGKGSMNSITSKMKLMVFGLGFSTVLLFIRAVYRTAELSNGWTGRIIHTQVYFNVLDGAMIVLAMYTLNIIHPGFLL